MPVPPKRKAKARSRKGRSHLALESKTLSKCPKCKKTLLPHHACAFCGYYKGKEVKGVAKDLGKKKEKK